MSAKILIDEAIHSYNGDALEMVPVGGDHWPGFLAETGLTPVPAGNSDMEVVYCGVPCRGAVAPDGVKLILGD